MSSEVLRNTYYSSVGIYFEYLLGLIISILVARTLGVEAFGVYSYLVRVAGLCVILTNAGIGIGAIKFIAEARVSGNNDEIKAIHNYFQRIQLIKIVFISAAVIALSIVFPGVLIEDEYQHLIWFLIIAIAFKSSYMYRIGILKGFERFDFLAYIVLAVAPINLIGVAIAWWYELGVNVMYAMFSFVSVLYFVVSELYLRKIGGLNTNLPKTVLSKSLKLRIDHHLKVVSINTVISVLVLGQCEILILKYFASNDAVAFFNIATVLSNAAISLVPGVYSLLLLPMIAKSVADVNSNPADKVNASIRYLFILSLMVATPSFVYCDDIVVFLYGSEFSEAGWIFGAFTLIGVLTAFRGPINAYLLSADKQSLLLKFSFFSLFLSLAVNILLTSVWGLKGAVAAFCIVSCLLTFFLLIITRRFLRIDPNWGKLIITIASAFISILFTLVVSGLFAGIVKVVVGFVVFGLLYTLSLIVLGGLNESDYIIINRLSKKGGGIVEKFISTLISWRLKL